MNRNVLNASAYSTPPCSPSCSARSRTHGADGLRVLRAVLGERGELHVDRLRDVDVRIGLLGGEPKVRDLEGLEALVEQLGEHRPGRRVRHDAVSASSPACLWSQWLM